MSKASRPFSPKYLNVSSYQFAHLVLNTTSSNRAMVIHWFRNVKVVHFFRQYARLFDKVTHAQLEQDYLESCRRNIVELDCLVIKNAKSSNKTYFDQLGVSEN